MATPLVKGKQWRFEAIDLRAGLGIALWREQRSTVHGLPHDPMPALFFGPPHFQPEPVVNTAVALAACRGSFEPGLYVEDGTEASFDTPEEVAEFLRRAYVNGAGGDGTIGGAPGPQPPAPGGGDGPREPPQLPDSPLVMALAQRIKAFADLAGQTPPGKALAFSWGEPELEHGGRWIGTPRAHAVDPMGLVVAALALVDELLLRMPDPAQSGDWLTWYDDLRELACLVHGLGAAELLLDGLQRTALEAILARSRLFDDEAMPPWTRFRLGWLFLFGPAIPLPGDAADLTQGLLQLEYEYGDPHRHMWLAPLPTRVDDPLDTLSRLPLPRHLQWLVPEDVGNRASLYHLLNVMVSEPVAATRRPGELPFAVCLALLAAACLAAWRPGAQQVAALPWNVPGPRPERARRTVEQAHAWLIEHLPRFVYAASYEALLGKSKAQRYATPPPLAPAPSPAPPAARRDPGPALGA